MKIELKKLTQIIKVTPFYGIILTILMYANITIFINFLTFLYFSSI